MVIGFGFHPKYVIVFFYNHLLLLSTNLFFLFWSKTDDFLQRESINWYEYVRRVLDLPSSGGLVQVLGICVENGMYTDIAKSLINFFSLALTFFPSVLTLFSEHQKSYEVQTLV